MLKKTVLIILCSYTIAFGQKFPKQAVQDDLNDLYYTLQQAHYDLYAYQNKLSYYSLFIALKSNMTHDSLNLLETVSLYQHLVSFANTGHCEIDFPAASYIEYLQSGGTVFPLELSFENNRTFIRKPVIKCESLLARNRKFGPILFWYSYPG